MKELKYVLLYTIIFQIISWFVFMIGNETNIIPFILSFIIIPIALIALYFSFIKNLITLHKLDRLKFNILLTFTWIFITGINTFIFLGLVDNHIISVCSGSGWDCFLNGIEYLLFGIILGLIVLVIAIIKIIVFVIKRIRKKCT